MFGLKLIDDLIKAPGEGKHIGVLLLLKLGVDTQSGILRGQVELVAGFLLLDNRCGIGETAHACLRQCQS